MWKCLCVVCMLHVDSLCLYKLAHSGDLFSCANMTFVVHTCFLTRTVMHKQTSHTSGFVCIVI